MISASSSSFPPQKPRNTASEHPVDSSTDIREPVAIVGIGCRFPGGAGSPDALWDLLCRRTDAISRIPKSRWIVENLYDPDYRTRGRMHVREGGFIDGVDEFDARFFSVAPVEARSMDPAQRLLLEFTWNAFEDAGIDPVTLEGTRTGVFVGTSASEYAGILQNYSERAHINAHTNTGSSPAIAANRISYVFNLNGPSFAVDTACSASMVAAHLACRSLWSGESTAAVLAGVNLMLKPELHIGFSTAGFLSKDARCRTFDARADGYVRSEGVGVVILKPLDAAIRDGNRIYATIIGSAINEDGRTAGIALPNPDAQIRVMEAAYRDAGISPARVDYVEAHGTGTAAGDPLECRSIGTVIGRQRGEPCLIGSIKSNIGHTELASGVAGLIKTALCLYHGQVPPNVHFETPNPQIDFDGWKLCVPVDMTALPRRSEGTIAGVNAFGFGGANAHLVLRSVPLRSVPALRPWIDSIPLLLSARSESALKALAVAYRNQLQAVRDKTDFVRIAALAAQRRSHLDLRAVVVASSSDEAVDALGALASGSVHPRLLRGRPTLDSDSRVAFVYSGQGGQWFAMGRELLDCHPVFKDVVSQVDAILQSLGWLSAEGAGSTLLDELKRDKETSRMNETCVAQPALFALQVALTRVWASMGIAPGAVVGHSIGEVAAAHVSGALSLEEATRVVYWRSRCQSVAAGRGRMLALGLSADEAEEAISSCGGAIDVAAVNGPAMCTVAGPEPDLEQLARRMASLDVFHRFLVVDVPFHCRLLEDVTASFVEAIDSIACGPTRIPLYSTVYARQMDGTALTADYWAANIRRPVQFYGTMTQMVADGFSAFVEIGPHPIVSHGVEAALERSGRNGLVVPSLRRTDSDSVRLSLSLGQLHAAGLPVDWTMGFGSQPMGDTALPLYPFDRVSYWLESEESSRARRAERVCHHPHLQASHIAVEEPGMLLLDVVLDPRTDPWLGDHRVQGPLVFPGAGHVDLAIAAGQVAYGESFSAVTDIAFMSPLFLPDDGDPPAVRLQIELDSGDYTIGSVFNGSVTVHSRGRFERDGTALRTETLVVGDLEARLTEAVSVGPLRDLLERGGLRLGPAFRGISRLHRGDGEAFGVIDVHPSIAHSLGGYRIHPALLDAAFQSAFGIIADRETMGVYIPRRIARVRWSAASRGSRLYSHATGRGTDAESLRVDIRVADAEGQILVTVEGFEGQYLKGSRGEIADEIDHVMYRYVLEVCPRKEELQRRRPGRWLPSNEAIRQKMEDERRLICDEPEWQSFFDALCPAMDRLALSYMVSAFVHMGLDMTPGKALKRQSEGFAKVLPRHEKLLERILFHLEAHGVIRSADDGWTVTPQAAELVVTDILEAQHSTLSAFRREISFFADMGEHLGPVLMGQTDPSEVLFSTQRFDILEDYYANAHTTKKTNRLAHSAVRRMVSALPLDQTIRVLEIGAGTGGVTSVLLPLLPPKRAEYVFTDLSPVFLTRARERFSSYPFVRYGLLDIEADPASTGEIGRSFDLVVASNVIHATADVVQTLSHVRQYLAPGGLLLLSEVTAAPMYLDVSFGMTDGWWAFLDTDRRPSHCTLASGGWRQALSDSGFAQTLSFCDVEDHAPVAQTLFVAREPEVPEAEVTDDRNAHAQMWLVLDAGGCAVSAAICEGIEADGGLSFAGKIVNSASTTSAPLCATSVSKIMNTALDAAKEKVVPFAGVVFVAGFDGLDPLERSGTSVQTDIVETTMMFLSTLSAMTDADVLDLWIVLPGDEDSYASMIASPLMGLSRVAMNEKEQLSLRMAQLGETGTDANIAALIRDIRYPVPETTEEELVFRDGRRYVRRMEQMGPRQREIERQTVQPARGTAFALMRDATGMIDGARFREVAQRPLEADAVRLEVHAVGLNFRDAMVLASALPDEAVMGGIFADHPGLECSGRVMEVGSEVRDIRIGQRVMAIAPGSLSGTVVTRAAFVRAIPDGMDELTAAALPMALLTAWQALVGLANVGFGERVLIHSASGAVGHAAVHVARALGARVYATASVAKQAHVRGLGVEAVLDSRSLRWFDELMGITAGDGVDVVLNSLAGDHIGLGLRALSPGGRFVEIGKADLYSRRRIALRSLSDNQAFFSLDIDRLLLRAPKRMARSIDEALAFVAKHGWPAIPMSRFPISDATAVLADMAKGRGIGKRVLSVEGDIAVSPPTRLSLKAQGVWLIAGGTRGFGLSVAGLLVNRGARHLVLVSRSGVTGESEMGQVEALRQVGAQVEVVSLDISDAEAVTALIERIHTPAHPLQGVIQSTLQLSDAMLEQLDREQMAVPMVSKIAGTWNLHRATRGIPLFCFVSFSSISSLYGFPGQGNYAAANAFLDALCHYRRGQGLVSANINFGAIGDVGFVARTRKVADFLSVNGWESIRAQDALAALERVLLDKDVSVGVFRVDWNRVAEAFAKNVHSARFGRLHRRATAAVGSSLSTDDDVLSDLASLDITERLDRIQTFLRQVLSRIVGISADELDVTIPITRFGLDSLMANQVRSVITARLGVEVSLMQILQGPSIATLSGILCGGMHTTTPTATTTGAEDLPNEWFPYRNPVVSPALRLFCLPYMGAGASLFSKWSDRLPPHIEVCPVQLPGRETRMSVVPLVNAEALIGSLADAMRPLLDRPFALYGHSFGGNLAFSVASWLEGHHQRRASRVFIAAASPPGVENSLEQEFQVVDAQAAISLDEAQMAALLQRIGASEKLLSDPALLRSMLPALRADLAITRQRLFPLEHRIEAPLTAIWATEDHLYNRDVIAGWERHASKFTLHDITGGHLFVHEPEPLQQLMDLLTTTLSGVESKC